MDNIDFKSGEIIFDEFHVDFSKLLSEQLECLSEDLLQVRYAGNYLIDVGWYPEYEEEGSFIVQVIRNENWEKPILKMQCKEKDMLIKNLLKAIEIAKKSL